MKLYVVRHGRTNCNERGIFNGRYDEDINIIGVHQAKILANKIKKLNIDLIISSPMKRAVSTTNIINVNNVPIILDDKFIERNMGDLTFVKPNNIDYKEYTSLYSTKYIGLETISDLMERVFNGLDNIKEKYNDKNILIVTHGAVTRCINAYFNGLTHNSYIAERALKNCEIKEYNL